MLEDEAKRLPLTARPCYLALPCLTIPYRYSIPLMAVSTLLHWLVSKSIFYVLVMGRYVVHREYVPSEGVIYSTCAWSPIAIICAVCVGFAMFVAAVVLGCRRMKSRVPLAGNCSAAISAACHPRGGAMDAATKPVRWGEVSTIVADRDEPAHCSFSAGNVLQPTSGRLYS